MKSYIFGAVCASLAFSAFATQGKWIEGYGQGNLEYFIDKKNMRLYVGCPTQDGSESAMSSVSLSDEETGIDVKQFLVTVNGNRYDGPFSADSRVGSSNFKLFMSDLRQGDALVKYGNTTVLFPKSNAAKVIPVQGKSFYCNTFF